jgi:hypothetical protein
MVMGVGVGMGLGQQVAGIAAGGNVPEDAITRLKKIKELLDQGLITEEEFNAKKKEILAKV